MVKINFLNLNDFLNQNDYVNISLYEKRKVVHIREIEFDMLKSNI